MRDELQREPAAGSCGDRRERRQMHVALGNGLDRGRAARSSAGTVRAPAAWVRSASGRALGEPVRATRHDRAPPEARDGDHRGHDRGRGGPSAPGGSRRTRRPAHPGDDALAEALRDRSRREGEPERRRRLSEIRGLLAASGAPVQMTLDPRAIVDGQHPDRELREELPNVEAGHGRSLSWFARRTLMSAVRSRVFTVPSGIPSASAISRAVSPPKYARPSNRFSASERDSRARIAASRSISGSSSSTPPISRHLVDEHEVRARHARLPSQPVDREVVRDRHEPRRQATAGGVEPSGLAPCREEDVLGQLLRRLRAPEQPQAQREDRTRVARVERAHGFFVAGKEPLHELLLLAGEERSVGPSAHPVSFPVYDHRAAPSLARRHRHDATLDLIRCLRARGSSRCSRRSSRPARRLGQ